MADGPDVVSLEEVRDSYARDPLILGDTANADRMHRFGVYDAETGLFNRPTRETALPHHPYYVDLQTGLWHHNPGYQPTGEETL